MLGPCPLRLHWYFVFAGLAWQVPVMPDSVETLVTTAVQARNAEYAQARDHLLALPPSSWEPELKRLAGANWEARLTAEVLQGWATERPLFEKCDKFLRGDLPGLRPMTGYTPPIRGQAIANLDAAVVPHVLELLWKYPEPLRDAETSSLFVALAALHDRRAVEPCLLLLAEARTPVWQRGAILALAATADERALPALLDAATLDQPDASVRRTALAGLANFSNARATNALLDTIRIRPRAKVERQAAAVALFKQAGPELHPVIAELLSKEDDADVQVVLILLLGRTGTTRELPILERYAAAGGVQAVSEAAAKATAEIRGRSVAH